MSEEPTQDAIVYDGPPSGPDEVARTNAAVMRAWELGWAAGVRRGSTLATERMVRARVGPGAPSAADVAEGVRREVIQVTNSIDAEALARIAEVIAKASAAIEANGAEVAAAIREPRETVVNRDARGVIVSSVTAPEPPKRRARP